MAGRRRGISVRNVLPWSAGAQHPENPVQHFAGVSPRATATIGAKMRLRNQRLEDVPLRVLEIHGSLLGTVHDAVREQLNSPNHL
jgi:hypothetical protein